MQGSEFVLFQEGFFAFLWRGGGGDFCGFWSYMIETKDMGLGRGEGGGRREWEVEQ